MKQLGVCYNCNNVVGMQFKVRPLVFKKVTIPEIKVGVCGICDSTISIPHESVPVIKKALEAGGEVA